MAKVEKENVVNGQFIHNRNCTDILMIIVFLIFLIGWIVVTVVAVQNGKPARLLMPGNFRGDLCGDGDLSDYPNVFYPKPSRLTYGLCVTTCPKLLDYACNNDKEPMTGYTAQEVRNTYYSMSQRDFAAGLAVAAMCPTSNLCSDAEYEVGQRALGLKDRLSDFRCFLAVYDSAPTLYRCLPFQPDRQNLTLAESMNITSSSISDMMSTLTAGQFLDRGIGETRAAWLVIVFSAITACVISLLWVFLLRFILAPVVYTCLTLVFAVLIGIAFIAREMASDLEDVKLPGDDETETQIQMWTAIMYIAFAAATGYFFLVIWLLKRIRIGMELMKEGGKAFLNAPYLVLIPPIVTLGLAGMTAFFIVTAIYIQTIGELENSDFTSAADSAFGSTATNFVAGAVNSSSTSNNGTSTFSVNVTDYDTSNVVRGLHAYNFFGFLWVVNYFIMEGFFVTCMVTCVWYFSASAEEVQLEEAGDKERGKTKTVPFGTVGRALWVTFRYHLGTILFGSLLIAIVQFIRAVALWIEREFLDKFKDDVTVKVIICVINCFLWCIEKIVKLVNKSAFTVVCIKNVNFCSGCADALGILVTNAVRVGTLASMVNVTTFLLKLFICATNTVIGYALLQNDSLIAEDRKIESGLFPLLFIFLVSYLIASIFLNVYESCVDTVMMCFFVDEAELEGAFMPETLAKLVGMFSAAEEARRAYEDKIRQVGKEVKASADKS
eukprot:PhM_4_TR2090/c0_g1_i1/m.20517/K15377/SLC44A2_4_5; solute carrier family 44 (choline transporter-like protein), member 2/4/5